MADRADQLVDVLGEAVIRKSGLVEVTVVLPHDDVFDAMCRANIRSILAAMVDETQFDSAPATQIGVQRARTTTALSSLMASDLFDTFQAWQDNDSSVRVTARQLAVHPNTVRHRLRRIEKHTGRSLSRPRDLAELCLAFEVHRRLM